MLVRTKVLFLIIVLIAVFFSFWSISVTPPGLFSDEAINGNNASEALATQNWKVFYPENNGREGLFINIQSFALWLFGNQIWALRVVSAAFGVLTLIGIFLFTRLLFYKLPYQDEIALISSFFTAASFWHINFSRIGFRAIMAPFFLIWGLYFFLKFYKNIGSSTSQTISAVVGGLLLGLGAHSYIAFRIVPLLLIIFIILGWFEYKKDPNRKSCFPCLTALFLFFALVAALPLGLFFIQNPEDFLGRTSQISIFTEGSPFAEFSRNAVKTLGMFWVWGDGNWRHNFAYAPQLFWPVGIAFLIGIFTAVKKILERKANPYRPIAIILLSGLIILILPVVISSEGLPHALRAILVMPFIFILSAWGVAKIIAGVETWLMSQKNKFPEKIDQLKRIQNELLLLLFAAFLVIGVHGFNQYFLRWAINPGVADAFQSQLTQKGKWLLSQPADLKKYVVTAEVSSIDLRGRPMSLQPILFITDTFYPNDPQDKNLFYISLSDIGKINCLERCVIVPVEESNFLYAVIKDKIPETSMSIKPGFIIFQKALYE